jgi:antibiotic biosynthesis monooxygenase (ABM) superfamily enzyme
MSKIVRIVSKKILKSTPNFSRVSLVDYTNELSECARNQPGFISSNSYWKTPISGFDEHENDLIIISISEWENFSYWNKWFKSNQRSLIYSKHENIIEKENFALLKKKVINDDVFLL